jgi:hypothetical protein
MLGQAMFGAVFGNFGSDRFVLGVAWALFLAQVSLDYYVHEKAGIETPMVGLLLKKGYQWTFGLTIGLTFFVAVIASALLLNAFTSGSFPSSFGLIVQSVLCYLLAVIGLNLWGKHYLHEKGMPISQDVGWRWFVRSFKEDLAKEKDKQAQRQQHHDK